MIIFAEISPGEIWLIVLSGIGTVISLIALCIIAFKKTDVALSPNPLSVELVESLVTKADFKEHVANNDTVHKELFSKVGGVERGGRDATERQVTDLRKELSITNGTMHELKGEMKQLTSQLSLIQQELQKR